jgi:hypothetical protein
MYKNFNLDAAMSQLKTALHVIERLKTTKVKAKWSTGECRTKTMTFERRRVKILIREIKGYRDSLSRG